MNCVMINANRKAFELVELCEALAVSTLAYRSGTCARTESGPVRSGVQGDDGLQACALVAVRQELLTSSGPTGRAVPPGVQPEDCRLVDQSKGLMKADGVIDVPTMTWLHRKAGTETDRSLSDV